MWYDKYFTNDFLVHHGRLPESFGTAVVQMHIDDEIRLQGKVASVQQSLYEHNKRVLERIRESDILIRKIAYAGGQFQRSARNIARAGKACGLVQDDC